MDSEACGFVAVVRLCSTKGRTPDSLTGMRDDHSVALSRRPCSDRIVQQFFSEVRGDRQCRTCVDVESNSMISTRTTSSSANRRLRQPDSKPAKWLSNADSDKAARAGPYGRCSGSTNPTASTAPDARGRSRSPRTGRRSNSAKTARRLSPRRTRPAWRHPAGGNSTRSPYSKRRRSTGSANPVASLIR